MSRRSNNVSIGLLLCGILLFSAAIGFANAKDASGPVRIGIVGFLGGAGSVGLPIRSGAQLIVDAINDGTLPPPFKSAGLGIRGQIKNFIIWARLCARVSAVTIMITQRRPNR